MDLRLNRADVAVLLDIPTWNCLAGTVRRYFRYRGRTRPDLAPDCPERLTVEHLRWIWSYRKKRRPRILQRLQAIDPTKQVVILKSRRAVDVFVSSVPGHVG